MKIEDYFKYYIQGSEHYLIPKAVFDELFNEMENWKEEAKELKKQLEEYKKLGFKHLNDKCNKLETQQKEFIKYLEDEIYSFELRGTSPEYNFENVLKRILLKFKKIIGVSDDKTN